MRPFISIAIVVSACLHSSLSWGSFNGMGIWCESAIEKTNDLGFFIFDDIKVGYFKNKLREGEKYDLTYIDVSLYNANTKRPSDRIFRIGVL